VSYGCDGLCGSVGFLRSLEAATTLRGDPAPYDRMIVAGFRLRGIMMLQCVAKSYISNIDVGLCNVHLEKLRRNYFYMSRK